MSRGCAPKPRRDDGRKKRALGETEPGQNESDGVRERVADFAGGDTLREGTLNQGKEKGKLD